MADKTLTLGTLFTGDGTTLLTTLKNIKTQINMIATAAKQLQTSMGAMNTSVKTGQSAMTGFALSTKNTVASIRGAVGESSKLKQALSQLNSVAAKTKTGFDSAHTTLMKVEKAIHATGQRMTAAGKNGRGFVDTANRMALVNQTLTGKLKTTATGFQQVGVQTVKASTATKKATGEYVGFSKQIAKVHGGLARVKAAFKVTASYGIAATAIYAVVTAMKSGVQAMVDYDQGLKNLQAITGATDAEVMAMGETIKSVARETKFSTSEVAEGMTLLGQAGFDAGESMAAMNDTAMLATGTLSDMKTTTDLVTTTVRAFGLQATDSGRVVDVMANAINKSKLTIDKLRIAFNYIGATAAQAGLTIEQVAATAMNFANSGLRASTIGTGFRQVLSKLLKPSERLSNALAAVGLNLDDVNPKMVGWQGSLNALTNILYDSETKTVDMAKAFSLFGLRGAQAAAVIVSSFVSGKYQDALNKVYELGTAEEMAAKQAEGLALKIKNLVDRAKNVAVAFGEAGATSALKLFIDGLRGVVVGIETFAGTIAGQAVIQLAALTGGLRLAQIATVALYSGLMKFTAIQAVVMTFRGLATTLSGATGLSGALVTAGLYLRGFLAALGPVKIILLAVTGAILAYRNAMQASIKELELSAVKQMQVVNSLKAYAGALEATGKKALRFKDDVFQGVATNQAYIATLQRLIKAHPELADKIQLTTDAYKENNRVLEEFISDAHMTKIEALVELHREYGEAAEDAKVWRGVWEDIKLGMQSVWDLGVGLGKLLGGLVETGIELIGLIPGVGGALNNFINKELKATETLVKESITWWKEYFKTIGRGSVEFEKLSVKQKEVAREIADSYLTLKEKATMSFGAIKRDLEAMVVDGKKLSNELIHAIILSIGEGRKATSTWVKTHGEALQSMTAAWLTYYSKQDLDEKFNVQKKIASLEATAKKYKEFLLGQLGADEQYKKDKAALEERVAAEMVIWWNKELANYIANEEKRVSATEKAAEKRVRAIEKEAQGRVDALRKIEDARKSLIEKMMSLEERLYEDIKRFRQADMTDVQKYNMDMAEARETLAKAITQAAKAQTQAEIAAAMEMLDKAREAYSDLASSAVNAFEKGTSASQAATREIKIGFSSIIESWEDLSGRLENPIKVDIPLENTKLDIEAVKKKVAELQEKIEEPKIINVKEEEAVTKIDTVKTSVQGLNALMKDGKVYEVNFTGDAGSTGKAGLIPKIKEVLGQFGQLGKKVTEKREAKVDFTGNPEGAEGGGIGLISAIQQLIAKIDEYISKLGEIPEVVTTVLNLRTKVNGQDVSTSRYNDQYAGLGQYQDQYKGLGQYQDQYKGLATGGPIPGFGGGDTVPSMLERGEFVIKKEAVSKYGAGFFGKLNSMMPGAGGQIGGAGLHTINLNVNNTPHTLYGDEQAVSGLVKSLRRAQLVTA